jgi:hypothetical protein
VSHWVGECWGGGVPRVPHGYGFTRGFLIMGHTGMGAVPKLGTRVKTVPLTAVLRVFTVLAHIWQELDAKSESARHCVFSKSLLLILIRSHLLSIPHFVCNLSVIGESI